MNKIMYGSAGMFLRAPLENEGGNSNSNNNGGEKNIPTKCALIEVTMPIVYLTQFVSPLFYSFSILLYKR